MRERPYIAFFRYTEDSDHDTDCFVLHSATTGEEHTWEMVDEYPADEFLSDEKLDGKTLELCGLQFLRWLAEEDNVQAADLAILPHGFGISGLLVVRDGDGHCEKLKDFYKHFSCIGKLNGTPFEVVKIAPA